MNIIQSAKFKNGESYQPYQGKVSMRNPTNLCDLVTAGSATSRPPVGVDGGKNWTKTAIDLSISEVLFR